MSALRALKMAAQATPTDSAVQYQLALVYRKQGREEDAKKAFALLTELRRSADEESQLRFDCEQKLDQGRSEEAHAVCGRLYDPNNAGKLTALGTIYGQRGDLEAALEPLRRTAELEPQSPQMQYNLAFTYYELDRLEEARVPIAQAVERWPDLFQLNSLYGAVLLKMGREREAWPVLQRAHRLNQEDQRTSDLLCRAALSLARSSLGAGEYGDASQAGIRLRLEQIHWLVRSHRSR
jgi:Flp pilus assembly protein TadD